MSKIVSVYDIISPVEREYAYPLIEIAKYIRRHLEEKPSKHHITRIYDPLTELAERGDTANAVAKIMVIFDRHYGFYTEKEREQMLLAVVNLANYVYWESKRNPSTVHQVLRNMRDFLYALVKGVIPLPYSPEEEEEGGETHA